MVQAVPRAEGKDFEGRWGLGCRPWCAAAPAPSPGRALPPHPLRGSVASALAPGRPVPGLDPSPHCPHTTQALLTRLHSSSWAPACAGLPSAVASGRLLCSAQIRFWRALSSRCLISLAPPTQSPFFGAPCTQQQKVLEALLWAQARISGECFHPVLHVFPQDNQGPHS